MALSAIVALCLLALASAAPQCSTSCDISTKMGYVPGTTYSYDYTGKNIISVDGAVEGSSTSDVSATVSVTILSACDVAFSFKNVAGSNSADIEDRQVEKYPFVVAYTNGKLEKICSHPEDDVSSINLKKAVASTFQNVLQTLEPTPEPQVYTEEDVVGICPTKYTVEAEGDKTVVTKDKIHSNCLEQYFSQTKTSFLPAETPLPIQDSRSSCIMEITNGLYSSVRCKDTKYITPGFGIFKVVKATQEINYQLASDSADAIDLSSLEGQVLKSQSVKYMQELPIKNPAVVPRVDAIMPEICTLSQGQGNKQVASLVAQVIELLRFVPDDAIVEVLGKIRAGEYCAEYTKLESLFLDAVAFVGEPGAFKVMAQEIAAGSTTGGRFSLYTVAINLLTKPTLNHVAALTPIFGMPESNQLISLAASTVVNRYCAQNADCYPSAPIEEILVLLAAKLDTQCTPDISNIETTKVLTTLKSVGNIGIITPEVFAGVMKCVKTEGIDTNVRFAATMSFKGSPCLSSVTQSMKAIALDASMNTEVRIGSYLTGVKCANDEDLEEVITAISSEENKQVQGFIFSHLQNLQETNWPLKQMLREKLASKTIPNDYIRNILKYSRNFEVSVNAPIIELGSLAESNIVYTPESYVPRLVNLGLNMNLLGSFINIGEVGVRVEGFDTYFDDAIGPNSYLYKEVFGPDSYLYKTPLWSVIEDSKLFMTQRGTEILQQIQTLIKENDINPDTIIQAVNKIIENSKNVNADSVLKAFNEVLKNAKNIDIESAIRSVDFDSIIKSIMKFLNTNKFQLPKTDLYAIIRAQERAFLSFGGEQNSFTINELLESVIPVIMNAIVEAQDLNVDITRTGQINIDYSIPTISGMPLKLKLSGTGVAGIQLRNNLNVAPGAIDASLKIIPSLNFQVEGQVGFGDLLNTGLKLRSNGYTTNGIALNVVQKNGEDLELLVELPNKMEFFDIDTELYFVKLDKASSEVKLIPSYLQEESDGGMNDVRVKGTSCSNPISTIIEPVTGLKICYKMNIQDITQSKNLPIAEPMMLKIYLEKSDAAMKGYRLAAKLKNEPNNKLLKIVAGTYGAAESKESTLQLSYVKEDDTHIVATNFQSTLLVSAYEWTFVNQPEYKSLQYYTSQEIGSVIAGEGSIKVDFKPIVVDNGITYEVATYAGFTKSLDEKNRLFQTLFSLLKNEEMTAASFLTKTDLFPASFEAVIELPSDAGLQIYKIESIILRSTVSSLEVESKLLNKFSDTKLGLVAITQVKLPMVELSASSELTYENGVIAYSGKLKHYSAEIVILSSSLNLDISAPKMDLKVELPVAEMNLAVGYSNGVIEGSTALKYLDAEAFAMNTKLSFVNYEIEIISAATFLNKKIFFGKIKQVIYGLPLNSQATIQVPDVFIIDFYNSLDLSGVKTVLQVEVPALIKPLKINNEFGITNAFSYSFLTDVTSGESVVLHVEGPLTYVFSKALVQENLDLKISGAFDGEFKVNHGITLSLETIQYTVDVKHTSSQIISLDIVVDRTNPKEITGKFNVNIPFVTESELAATISTSLIHSTMNALVLPSTDYARRFKGYSAFNWVENNFKGEFLWDAEKNTDKKVELSTKYALDTTAFKFLLQGELTVTAVTYGYRLESVLASPFDFFQGKSGLEFALTMPSEKTALAKASLDIAYADSQVTLKPLIAFTTNNEISQYELTSTVVVKLLPALLNFEVTCETTLLTPQLQTMEDKIVLISKLLHEDKEQAGKIAFILTLKESVLSKECSFEYILDITPLTVKETLKAQHGTNVVSLVSDIVVNSGIQDFMISHELNLPLEVVKSVAVKLTKTAEGTLAYAFVINDKKIINIYYSIPELTNHIVGIEFPSRAIELNTLLASNQVSFKILPAKNKNDKVVELVLRLTPKASAVQLETLLTAPSLTKEMRFAVELELIEPGKEGYDMVSIDVQYQVTETPEFLKAVLKELQSLYEDLVNDGLFPDLNELYKLGQKLITQLPGVLNNIKDQIMSVAPQYYEQLKNLVLSLYQLYEPDITALLNKIQSDLLMYLNIIKTEAPVLLNNYMEVIMKTETWNVIQSILNEVMLNYPAYYAAVVDFYNKVIVPYLTDLSETVSKFLVLPNLDFQQYWTIVITDVPALFVKYSQIVLESQLVQELKISYPEVFEIIADLYSKVVIPTSIDIIAFIQKVTALPVDFQIYWTTIQTEVPAIATQFGQRLLDAQIVINFKAAFPTEFAVLEQLYSNIILPTFVDILAVIQKLISLPVLDFQESIEQYWNVIKVEVPILFNNFVERLPITELINELKKLLPTVFEAFEDFYKMVILPTIDDVVSVVDKLVAVPIADIQEAFTMYVDILKVEVPTLLSKFIQRIPNTQFMNLLQSSFAQFSSFLEIKFNELKEQYPELYAIALDFYSKVIVPAVSDLPMLYNKIITVTDIYLLRDFVIMDILSFVNNVLKNISTTDLFSKLMAVFDKVVAAYPDEYDMILKTYKQVTEVTLSDVLSATNSYLFEKFGMSFSISAEKFIAVVPLPVSLETLRSYYKLLTVFAPAYLVDVLIQYVDQGRIVYQYIVAQVPVVLEYVNTVAPIYLQNIKEYVLQMQVVIPQFINEIQAALPQYIDQVLTYISPLVEEIRAMIETSYKIARESSYGKFAEEKVRDIIELLLNKVNEIIELYPDEIQAVKDFVILYMNICLDYTTWVINTIVEHPAVQKIIKYIATLTPEKAQADLAPLLDFIMTVLRQVETKVTELITAIPQDLPAFISLHAPLFGLFGLL